MDKKIKNNSGKRASFCNDSIEKEVLGNRETIENENIELDVINPKRKLFKNKLNNLKVKYKKDKKKYLVILSSLFFVLSLICGSSYAYYSIISKTDNTTMIEAGTLALTLKNEANVISLNGAIPQKDSDALKNNSEYEFQIENTGSLNTNYIIKLDNTCNINKTYEIDDEEITPDKCIPNEYIKVGLKKGDEEYKVLEYDKDKDEYVLEQNTLNKDEVNEYKMKVWLDYDTPNDYNAEGIYNIIYSGKLSIDYEQTTYEKEEVAYKVSFNANGGSGDMNDQSFANGEEKNLSKNTFTKEGYTFIGWSTSKDSDTVKYADEEKVRNLTDKENEVIKLYAVWAINTQVVKVTVKTGEEVELEKEVKYGGNAEFTITTSEGYNSPKVTCTNGVTGTVVNNVLTIKNVTSDSTCTVEYTANTYRISYTLNGGTAGSSAPTSGTYDETATISNPSKTGYTFTGWTSTNINEETAYYGTTKWTDGSVKTKATSFKNLTSENNGTVALVANWEANKYTVEYYSYDGTTKYGTSSHTYGTSKSLTTASALGATSPFTNNTFYGWSTTASSTTKAYNNGASVTNLTSTNNGTVRLYAIWHAAEKTLTATTQKNVTSATGSNTTATCKLAEVYNKNQATSCEVTLPANPYTLTNWTFNGWVKGSATTTTTQSGTAAAQKMSISSNTNIIATWKKTVAVSLTFDKNGGSANTTSAAVNTTLYNGNTSLNASLTFTAPSATTKTGHTFVGYNTSSSATTSEWAAGGAKSITVTGTVPIGDKTFTKASGYYHIWKVNEYTVTLNKGTGISAVSGAGTYEYGEEVTIDATVIDGYTFWSWSDAYATSTKKYTFTMPARNVTIKANAKDITAPTSSIGTTSTLKKTSQTATLKCSDGVGVVGYYWGTNSSGGTYTTTAADLTALTGSSGLTKTVDEADTYYLFCKDEAGNVSTSTSKTYYTYTVNNLLETVAGTTGTYTNANYTSASNATYIAPSGTSITLASVYTAPTGASASTFKGYSTSYGTSAATVSTTAPSLSANATYYMWFNRTTVTLTLNKETGISAVSGAGTYKYGKQVTIGATASTGYTFVNWTKDSGNAPASTTSANTTVTLTQDTTLIASAGINTYKVTYDYATNGGTSADKTTDNVDYGKSIDLTVEATKSGWTFVGWNTDKDATSKLTTLTMPASNVTLYAIYKKEAKTYTATTQKNVSSATGTGTSVQCTIAAVYNGATQATSCQVTLPANPYTLSAWTFNGWVNAGSSTTTTTQSGTAASQKMSISSNVNIVATWKKTVAVTVTFDKNGGSANTTSAAVNTTLYNGNTSLDTSLTFTAPSATTYSGWTFVGYNTSSNATSSGLAVGGTKSIAVKGTVAIGATTYSQASGYYHIWTKAAKTYTATTQKNVSSATGTGTSVQCTIPAVYNGATQDTSCQVTLPANPYTLSGWTFNGWVNSGSGTTTTTQSGTAASQKMSISGNVNIVATWKKDATATFYYYNGSAQASATDDCTMYNGASSCTFTVPSAVSGSSGPSSTTYKGVSTSKSSTTTTTSLTSATTTYYAAYTKSITATFYYNSNTTSGSLTVATKTASGTRSATTNGTTYSVSNPTITIPTEVTGSVGKYNSPYVGVQADSDTTPPGSMANITTSATTANTVYWATYRKNVTIYYPTGASSGYEVGSTTTYRNEYFTSASAMSTKLATSATGTSDITAVSEIHGTLAGFNTVVNTNSNTYANIVALRDSNATTVYARTTTSSNVTFYYNSNTTNGSFTAATTTSPTTTTHYCKSTTEGTRTGGTTTTVPSVVSSSVGKYNSPNIGVSASLGSMTKATTFTGGSTYYAIYSASVKVYYPSGASTASNTTIYRNEYFTSKTEMKTVLSTGSENNSDSWGGGSPYGSLSGFASSANTTTKTYASRLALLQSNATTVYMITTSTITITYDANGGSGAPSAQSTTRTTYCTSTTAATTTGNTTISSTKPTRAGYTFLGWYEATATKYDTSTTYKVHPLYYYADTYSDLYNAFGYNEDSLYNHYYTYILNGSETRTVAPYETSKC